MRSCSSQRICSRLPVICSNSTCPLFGFLLSLSLPYLLLKCRAFCWQIHIDPLDPELLLPIAVSRLNKMLPSAASAASSSSDSSPSFFHSKDDETKVLKHVCFFLVLSHSFLLLFVLIVSFPFVVVQARAFLQLSKCDWIRCGRSAAPIAAAALFIALKANKYNSVSQHAISDCFGCCGMRCVVIFSLQ